MNDNLSHQITALMEHHKASLPSIEAKLQQLDQSLLSADSYIRDQILRIKEAHEARLDEFVDLLSEMRGRAPAIEDRYSRLPRMMTGHDAMLDAIDSSFRKVG
jgi:hypothetical protein